MAKINVCHECTERYLGCHDHCEKYLEEKQKVQERKDMISKGRAKDDIYYDYKRKKYK